MSQPQITNAAVLAAYLTRTAIPNTYQNVPIPLETEQWLLRFFHQERESSIPSLRSPRSSQWIFCVIFFAFEFIHVTKFIGFHLLFSSFPLNMTDHSFPYDKVFEIRIFMDLIRSRYQLILSLQPDIFPTHYENGGKPSKTR